MENNIFSVSHSKEFNLANGETISNVYVRVYTSMFTSGLVAKMGANRFTTLMALASYMDEQGECYPTQIQLADAIGVHKNTVNKYINELLDFHIDDKPLVTRIKINKGQGKIFSYYKIHPLSQVAKFNGTIESIDHKNDDSLITSKDTNGCAEIRSNNNHLNNTQLNKPEKITANTLLNTFLDTYREVYGNSYVVSNYPKTMTILKSKVLTPYPDQALEIVEQAVRLYDSKFKNAKFPRPTIAMFTWAVNQIIPMIEEENKLTEVAEQSGNLEELAEQAMLAKLNKLQ